jgi:pSer/pThr/pTyr-binding forkhead associated (FHA) protein
MQNHYSIAEAESFGWPVMLSAGESAEFPGVALTRPVCVVGARCVVHLPLPAQTVSKAQALMVRDAGGIYLRDLASKNQTYVNDEPVRENWLNPADVLRFGPYLFQCGSGFGRTDEDLAAPVAELWLEPDGLASRQVVALRGPTFLVGTRHGCDLLLRGNDISLAHAVFFSRDGHRYLRDLSTMSGTYVNGHRIREMELQPKDEIRIGMSRIEYHAVAGLQEPPEVVEASGFSEGETLPLAGDRVQFVAAAGAGQEPQQVEIAASTEDRIILPWDEPEPIELELVDSRVQ